MELPVLFYGSVNLCLRGIGPSLQHSIRILCCLYSYLINPFLPLSSHLFIFHAVSPFSTSLPSFWLSLPPPSSLALSLWGECRLGWFIISLWLSVLVQWNLCCHSHTYLFWGIINITILVLIDKHNSNIKQRWSYRLQHKYNLIQWRSSQ